MNHFTKTEKSPISSKCNVGGEVSNWNLSTTYSSYSCCKIWRRKNSNDPPLSPQTCGQPLFWKCPVFQAAAATDKAESVSLAQVDKDKAFDFAEILWIHLKLNTSLDKTEHNLMRPGYEGVETSSRRVPRRGRHLRIDCHKVTLSHL